MSMLGHGLLIYEPSPKFAVAIFDIFPMFLLAIGGVYYEIFLKAATKGRSIFLALYGYFWLPISPVVVMLNRYFVKMSLGEWVLSVISCIIILLCRTKIEGFVTRLISRGVNGDAVYLKTIKNRSDIVLWDVFYWMFVLLLSYSGYSGK
jgi:hypothetical protein